MLMYLFYTVERKQKFKVYAKKLKNFNIVSNNDT